jgi:NitT/TauT family transport system substrate-binding protein
MRRFMVIFTTFLCIVNISMATAVPSDTVTISVLKGPSGLSGAWMMSELSRTSPGEFRFITASSADMVVAKLLNGEIDAGVLPVNVAAKLYNAGVPLQALAVVGNGMVKFLTTDPAIADLQDLRGKTVYVAGQKATPDYLFQYLCAQKGLIAGKDYVPVYSLAYPEIAAGLASGKIAYAVLPEPFATQALQKNRAIRTPIDLTKEWRAATGQNDYPMSLFVVQKALVESSPDKVRILLDSYRASIQRAIQDPAGTGKLAESLDLGVSAQVATMAIPLSNFVFVEAIRAVPNIEALLSVFLQFDPASIGGVIPPSAFYAKIQ